MSWHYSRELVAAYWGEKSLDGEPCAQSRSTDIAGMSWSPDKTTDVSNRSRSGMTYEPLTDEVGEDVLTWCQEGSLVQTLVLQEPEQDLTENNPVFGPRCGGLLARFDPDTSLLKTPQCLLFEEGQESLQTLPNWGSMRDGELWEHTIPALLTSGTGSGLLPTPRATDGDKGTRTLKGSRKEWERGKNKDLAMVAKMWPTPRAQDSKHGAATEWELNTDHAGTKDSLRVQVVKRLWPTPAARDYKGSNSREHCAVNGTGRKHMDQLANAVAYPDLHLGTEQQEQTGGQLNPDWVEWLQGWIIGMTSTAPLPPDRFRAWERAFVPESQDSRQSETDRCLPVQH